MAVTRYIGERYQLTEAPAPEPCLSCAGVLGARGWHAWGCPISIEEAARHAIQTEPVMLDLRGRDYDPEGAALSWAVEQMAAGNEPACKHWQAVAAKIAQFKEGMP
jgi:hypothetical protein